MTYDQLVEAIQMTTNVNEIELLCDKTGLIFGNFEQQAAQFRELSNLYRGLDLKMKRIKKSSKPKNRTAMA